MGHFSLHHASRLALVQGSAKDGTQESSWTLPPQLVPLRPSSLPQLFLQRPSFIAFQSPRTGVQVFPGSEQQQPHWISVPREEMRVPSPGPRETLNPDTHTY